MNESGRRVDIHWIHPQTGEMVLQSKPDILNGASLDLNSYSTHTFQVRELPAKRTGECAGEENSASNLLDECRTTAKSKLKQSDADATSILDELAECVQEGVAKEIERANEEITFQAGIRKDMAGLLENYTCADEALNTTEAKSTNYWEGRKVSVMIDRPASRIHVVENFLTEDECKAVEEAAAPILHHATVADGSGGSELSDSRKAMQAGIK
eukprot:scaffold3489_cov255-Alexandrium_tamarense.AAC.1